MTEYIVSCSGCGRRYKGIPSPKKFKCSSCQSAFTFPNGPRGPATGKVLCACCWTEYDALPHPFPCPGCQQKVYPQYSGRAIAWAAGSSLTPSVADAPADPVQKDRCDLVDRIKDLDAKLLKAQTRIDELLVERDRAIAQNNQIQSELVQLRTEFQQYRTIAAQALEPLSEDFAKRARKLMERMEQTSLQARTLREEFVVRMEKVESDLSQSRQSFRTLATELNTQIASVIGTPPAPMEDIDIPAAKPAFDLPKGELTMTQAMNDLLTANGYAKATAVTPQHKNGK